MVHSSVEDIQLGHDVIDRGGGRRINGASHGGDAPNWLEIPIDVDCLHLGTGVIAHDDQRSLLFGTSFWCLLIHAMAVPL
jgi:hypothetical protein